MSTDTSSLLFTDLKHRGAQPCEIRKKPLRSVGPTHKTTACREAAEADVIFTCGCTVAMCAEHVVLARKEGASCHHADRTNVSVVAWR